MSLAELVLYFLVVGVIGVGIGLAVQFWRESRATSAPEHATDARK